MCESCRKAGGLAPEDLVPFAAPAYWRLFALENAAAWPAQPVLLAAGALLVFRLARDRPLPGRWLGPAFGAAWLWAGWQFVALRYGTLNWAAPGLAWAFYAEAALFVALGLSGRLAFPRGGPGVLLLAAAVLAWPLLAPLDGRPWREAEIVALAPDPTAMATLALLALAARNRWTALASAVPALWLAFSAFTLLVLGAWQGWAVLAALAAGLAARALSRRGER